MNIMAFPYCFIFGLLLYNIQCLPEIGHNDTKMIENPNLKVNIKEGNPDEDITKTNDQIEKNVYNRNDKVVTPKFEDDVGEIVRQSRPHHIKEDDKNGAQFIQKTQDPQIEVITMLAETLVQVKDSRESENTETKELENITTSSVKPFSPSPYLGSVIEEVIEEPIAQNRDLSTGTDFIPMRSRQSLQSFNEENHLPRLNLPFHTLPGVVPVVGSSYSLHSDNSIGVDFDNPDFNENPFGRIKFPDDKSKYFPLFLSDNEVDGREKPLKFDFDSNYKQYDFPYKIENAGLTPEEAQKEPHISDKTHFIKGFINNHKENSAGTVHGAEIMKNITPTLPLESKKKKIYPPSRLA